MFLEGKLAIDSRVNKYTYLILEMVFVKVNEDNVKMDMGGV